MWHNRDRVTRLCTLICAFMVSSLSWSASAYDAPREVFNYFARKPEGSSKNSGVVIPGQYDVSAALREEHVDIMFGASGKYVSALNNLQIVMLIDYSSAQAVVDVDPEKVMTGHDAQASGLTGGEWQRWDSTFKAAKYLAEAAWRFDKDKKVPLFFFSTWATEKEAYDTADLWKYFVKYKPALAPDLTGVLKKAFKKYARLNPDDPEERTLFIVLTSAHPNPCEEGRLKKLIERKLAQLDPLGKRLHMLFVRVGDDPQAAAFLTSLRESAEIGRNIDARSDKAIYAVGPENLFLNAIFAHLEEQPQFVGKLAL